MEPSQVGEGGNGGLLQDVKLVVDVGDGRTIVILLKGHLTIHHHSSSQAATNVPLTVTGEESSSGGAAQGEAEEQNNSGGEEQRQGEPEEQNNSGGEEQRQTRAEQQDDEARKYLKDMRGWIMTVATLFIGISFQAMTQRPSWMPEPKGGLKLFFTALVSNITKDPDEKVAFQVLMYVFSNTATFSLSLLVVVDLLLLPKDIPDPKRAVKTMTTRMTLMGLLFSLNFIFIFKNILTQQFVATLMAPTVIIILRAIARQGIKLLPSESPMLRLLASRISMFRQRNLVRSGEDNGGAQVQLPIIQGAA